MSKVGGVLLLACIVCFASLFYLIATGDETVTMEVEVRDDRYQLADNTIVMIASEEQPLFDDFERCTKDQAVDYAYVKDGKATFEFTDYIDESNDQFSLCSPFEEIGDDPFIASRSGTLEHFNNSKREYPTEGLNFEVQSVEVTG